MKVIAKRVSGRPKNFPKDKWIVLDRVYTVIDAFTAQPQNAISFVLEEIDLTGLQYTAFQAARFDPFGGISDKDFAEAISECFELDQVK